MKKVIIYTTKTCPHCSTAKEYLKEKGISYEEKDIATDMTARRELMRLRVRGVPAIQIEDEIIVGFQPEKIDQLIDFTIVKCQECATKLRIPKDHGSLTVTCPRCKHRFQMNT